MTTDPLVQSFYARIWNAGDQNVADLLAEDFGFRGSLGTEAHGHAQSLAYVRSVRGSLADYTCEVLDCVTEFSQAFARMRFWARHVAPFRGFPATDRLVDWHGVAHFSFRDPKISALWSLAIWRDATRY